VLLFAFAVACWIGSFWDGSLARSAATTGLIAGVILGRVQEHDLAARGQGLVPDEEP
jgi:hypothetical protein